MEIRTTSTSSTKVEQCTSSKQFKKIHFVWIDKKVKKKKRRRPAQTSEFDKSRNFFKYYF